MVVCGKCWNGNDISTGADAHSPQNIAIKLWWAAATMRQETIRTLRCDRREACACVDWRRLHFSVRSEIDADYWSFRALSRGARTQLRTHSRVCIAPRSRTQPAQQPQSTCAQWLRVFIGVGGGNDNEPVADAVETLTIIAFKMWIICGACVYDAFTVSVYQYHKQHTSHTTIRDKTRQYTLYVNAHFVDK